MLPTTELIESEALTLPVSERAELIVHLQDSLEPHPKAVPAQVEKAWLNEANRRYQSYLQGEEESYSADEVFADLRADDDSSLFARRSGKVCASFGSISSESGT
ncbi:addiction module protein [Alkalimonas amylolytica]|uniref:Putative addiction module component, TIGR02574 family n=1 Tax=Alkalimonas amylolytica TaxID=152573 RepID=A0A1H3ZQA7_ALKAM|nr:addiction module protein [Alkalimonas amylolytica]SEA25541.1 putative addiction module component, TIGR02574 family [Alkalimonas amylolytica]